MWRVDTLSATWAHMEGSRRLPSATMSPMEQGLKTHDEPPVVGRFAPTPSGRMHLGNVFSCLIAWLSARSAGGRMVLRIEDLDPRAHDAQRADQLMRDLEWLGLDWDEGPYRQSERSERYGRALGRLSAQGLLYPCFCTRAELHAASAPHASDGTYLYPGSCRKLSPAEAELKALARKPAMRLRVPDETDGRGTISFVDLMYGACCETLARECGDFLVRRSDGVYAYQLAVVVDDAEMGVTQVVRGRDLLGSVARQTYLYRLLGHPEPRYGHVPLLVAPDGRRLSKRDRDLDLGVIRESGITSERVVGRLASRVGLCDASDELGAADLVGCFSWETLRRHPEDIVVTSDFLR